MIILQYGDNIIVNMIAKNLTFDNLVRFYRIYVDTQCKAIEIASRLLWYKRSNCDTESTYIKHFIRGVRYKYNILKLILKDDDVQKIIFNFMKVRLI